MVSIIVPVYNVEKYLPYCIESILEQTFKDLQIILVDDGSTDRSSTICDEYADKDKRIQVIHKKNGGLSSARNSGIEYAVGEYCAFIDSDDYIAEDFVEKLVELCETTHSDIAVCDYYSVKESEMVQYGDISESKIERITTQSILDGKNAIPMVAWNKLYSKKVYSKVSFPEGKIHEDLGTFFYFMFYAKNIVSTTDKLYYYRCREGSIMQSTSATKHLDVFDVLWEQYQFFVSIKEVQIARKILLLYFDFTISDYRQYTLGKTMTPDLERTLKKLQNKATQALKNNHCYSLKCRIKHYVYLICPRIYICVGKQKKTENIRAIIPPKMM